MDESRLKVNKAQFRRDEPIGEVAVKRKVAPAGGGRVLVDGRSFKNVVAGEQSNGYVMQDQMTCLDFRPNEGMLDWLKDAYVGELRQALEASMVQQGLVMEGLHFVKVTGMGARMVLLKFEGSIDLEEVKNKHQHWWGAMFKHVRRWLPNMVAKSRSV